MTNVAHYQKDSELRRRINTFLQQTFELPEGDYYGRLDMQGLLGLKAALSDINNAVTMRLTLGFLDWASRSLPLDAVANAQIRSRVMRTKPSSNGYDIQCTAPMPFVAEVKCNIPIKGGTKYGSAQRAGIFKDIDALLQGKSKATALGPECLKFMVFIDLPAVRAANEHLVRSTSSAGAIHFLKEGEVPSNPQVVYGVYAALGSEW